LLADVPGLSLPAEPRTAKTNWQSFCVRLPPGCNQRIVMQEMLDAGVSTRRGIMCSHREAAYADLPVRHALPHSEAAQDESVILPLYHTMTDAELSTVAAALQNACRTMNSNKLARSERAGSR